MRKSVAELEKKFERMELEEARTLDPGAIKLENVLAQPQSDGKLGVSYVEFSSLKIDH